MSEEEKHTHRLVRFMEEGSEGGTVKWIYGLPLELEAEYNERTKQGESPLDVLKNFQEAGEDVFKYQSTPYDKDGYEQGIEEGWHPDGGRRVRASYEKGLDNGLMEFWDEDGTHTCFGIHKNQESIGLWYDLVSDESFPEEVTGPWFFFSEDEFDPIAWGKTAEDVMEQQAVKDYLAEKGLRVVELGYLMYVLEKDGKPGQFCSSIEKVMMMDETVQILMDRADVPWFDIHADEESGFSPPPTSPEP